MLTRRNFVALAYLSFANKSHGAYDFLYHFNSYCVPVTKSEDNTYLINNSIVAQTMREVNEKLFEIALQQNDIRFDEHMTLNSNRVFLSDCLIDAEMTVSDRFTEIRLTYKFNNKRAKLTINESDTMKMYFVNEIDSETFCQRTHAIYDCEAKLVSAQQDIHSYVNVLDNAAFDAMQSVVDILES